ncbi:NAD(P)/FAD-dependent oxidoreductase [Salinisphaera sp. P385]|uniref:NAD(P)/FAD-dependent oxidoreductase n=1 Tax=Spectribacter acetivorans TaxID=3075603 RepID=A0ABU3BC88_9GAMM|nr:NAD(P)/FAD-dependent oxidoreductase [Salinisphaera sp. P385]MDT0619725.1 NAD(P)/FAD-dependent oxidoreductase [Salinisphaera sp. P385]
MTDPDVIVLGGGAAGLMCAIEAGRRGRRVLVLEGSNRAGKKILMSGGGRCNFTNLDVTPENFLSANPHFCKSALARYTQWDFIALVERHGIAWHEKELGQLFCDESSKQIVAMLLAECEAAGVRIEVRADVGSVTRLEDEGFRVPTALGPFTAESLVVATGGLSIPKMGASGFGYELARQFGHRLQPTRAGLVPLTFEPPERDRYADLAGVALPAATEAGGHRFDAGLLFTHRGISGPAILQLSSYWQPGDTATVDLLPDRDAEAWLTERRAARPDAGLRGVLAEALPRRLAQQLIDLGLPDRPLRQLQPADIRATAERLHAWSFSPAGTEGYRTAEVTLGGVNVDEVSSSRFESKRVPGLFFIGEVLDVTGHLGGYNFQWAWASGHAAGQVV